MLSYYFNNTAEIREQNGTTDGLPTFPSSATRTVRCVFHKYPEKRIRNGDTMKQTVAEIRVLENQLSEGDKVTVDSVDYLCVSLAQPELVQGEVHIIGDLERTEL